MILGPIIISTPPIAALIEFFHAETEINVHPLPVSWYFMSSLWRYLYSCMHIISTLQSIALAASSRSWPILFKVLTLNIDICIALLHLSNFCLFFFEFCSRFFEQCDQSSSLSRTRPFLHAQRAIRFGHVVCVLVIIFRGLCFILVSRCHPQRRVAVGLRLNY